MKKIYLSLFFGMVFSLFIVNEIYTNTGGPSAGVAGAPTDQTCARSGCHAASVNSGPGITTITSTVPVGGYVGGTTYGITISIEQPGRSKFGFQAMAAYSSVSNKQVGTAVITNSTETQVKSNGNGQYVTHKSGGTAGADARVWSFNWTAPAIGGGDVEVYAALNASNSQNNTSGDHIYTDTLFIVEAPVGVDSELEEDFVKVYPTFFQDFIKIDGDMEKGNMVEITITDLSGKQVYSLRTPNFQSDFYERVETGEWGAGIYLVDVKNEMKRNVFKVVKR